MGQIKIQESTIELTQGRKGQMAILMYAGDRNMVSIVAKLLIALHWRNTGERKAHHRQIVSSQNNFT